MYSLGRTLQIMGLILPLLAIFLQLAGSISVGMMLTMLVAAVSVFYLGRIIEGYSR
jgi:hypothetical protein